MSSLSKNGFYYLLRCNNKHHHYSKNNKRYLSLSAKAKSLQHRAQELCGAPTSINAIPDGRLENYDLSSMQQKTPGAVIRAVGCTRRVSLLEPYLTASELEGLAYRLRVLTKNDGLNSILIATESSDHENNCLPVSAEDPEKEFVTRGDDWSSMFPVAANGHVASGYDPIQVTTSGIVNDPEALNALLDSIQQLALATRGGGTHEDDEDDSKIPVIAIPHGMVQDGGYALLLSSYVLATPSTCFRIVHPTRGLSLDPVGFSYFLPRLGQFYAPQLCQTNYPVGMILALTGYTANASDMVETGLATHYMGASTSTLGILERTLANLPPFAQQEYTQNPRQYQGQQLAANANGDHNAQFRNVAVANTIHAFTTYCADGTDVWDTTVAEDEDVAFPAYKDCHPTPWHEDRVSDLVNVAATLEEIFGKSTSVAEIMEQLRQVASGTTNDPEEQEGIDLCSDLLRQMNDASPLALCVTHRLLKMGQQGTQTLLDCMEREKRTQANMLLRGEDYQNWVQHAIQNQDNSSPTKFSNWKHKSVADVTEDEIVEMIAES